MTTRVPVVLWAVDRSLILAVDEGLGTPLDSYVNGSQTWHTDSGPKGETLEWRLHPVAAYRTPKGMSHYDVWEQVVAALSAGEDENALPLGDDTRPLSSLWDALECYEAFAQDLEPAPLAAAATEAVGIPPNRHGVVDHDRIGDEWEHARGTVSIAQLLARQLDET